ncbi:MAG: hypothetical protein AOA65_0665 [Candidatus Bathyarchaeota archaeon BA1]|nr:MAG: hypothetical protein AOA65_0665 [Candidatus Bathyarchaeota archaeon BA1]
MGDEESKIYRIVYCDSKFWNEDQPLREQVERTFRWYLLECPAVGIKDLATAKQRAREELKAEFGARTQVVIIGEEEGQHTGGDFDSLFGITVLAGANAAECKAPIIVFTKSGKKPAFYSRAEDLGIGKPW